MSNNKVTQSQINEILANSTTEEKVLWGKELVLSYLLPCGFSITESEACVDPNNFDIEIGRPIVKRKIENKLWELEGYVLQKRLYEETLNNCKCSSNKINKKTKEDWLSLFASYDFVDEQGQSLINCQDFIDLIDLATKNK